MATNPFDQFDAAPTTSGFPGVISGAPKAPPVPSGYEPDPARPGAVRPITGGPDDPATNDTLDDKTTTFYAQQILAGAPMPAMGMGKVASQNRQKVMAKVAEIAGGQGLSGTDLAKQIAHYQSGKKQLGVLETQLGTTRQNETTALLNGQQFLDRSAELPGQTQYPALNAITQFFQKWTPVGGHEDKVAMDQAYQTFVNEYAKVVAGSPSGAGTLTDSARHEAMQALSGNYSMSQKKAVFDQMKADMENRMIAMKGGINQGYDALVKQPGYDVPDQTSNLSVTPQKQQDHVLIPGVSNGSVGPGDIGFGAPQPKGPPGMSEMTPEQQAKDQAFLATNPSPTQYAAFMSTLLNRPIDEAAVKDRLQAIEKGASYTGGVSEKRSLEDRITTQNQMGLGEGDAKVLANQGATLGLSDEAAGVGNAAANILTSPFTGKFDPVGSYQTGRDVERQRIEDARSNLGYGGTAIEFAGGLASASPTNALAAVTNIPELMRQGAKAGAVGGALAGYGSGEGAQQSLSGLGIGAAGGAAIGALAPYAAGKLAARGQPQGMAPDLANASQAEGVDLIRPMVDPASRGKFGALESDPTAQPIVRAGAQKVRDQIEGRVADLGKGGTALEPGAAGEKLQLSGNRYIQRSRGIKDRLYKAAEAAGGDTKFVPQAAIDQADQELATLKENPSTNASEINFLQGIRDDLASPGGKTVTDIRNIRAGLRGAIGNSNLTMSGAEARANSILGAASEDIAKAVPAAGRLYKRADAFYRERQTVVDDIKRAILGQKNNPLDPQTAFQNIKTLSSPGGNLRRLSAVTSYLEPSERQDVAATVASTLGRTAQDGDFSASRFISQTDKMSPGALRTLFGSDGAQSISNLRTLSQALKDAGGDINYSRSTTVANRSSPLKTAARTLVMSLTGLGGYETAGVGGALTGTAMAGGAMAANAVVKKLSARAMVNPRVSQWLAQAADVSTPSQAKQAVKGLSLVISREPALAHELTPIRDLLDQRVTQLLAADPKADAQDQQQR